MASQDRNLRLRGGVYYARLTINGREISRSLRTGDRRIARARLKDLLEQADRARVGLTPRAEERIWQDAVIRFGDLHYPELAASTVTRYKVSLRALDAHFKDRPIAKLGQADFSGYAALRMKAGVSTATVRRDLTVASAVMSAARRAGWAKENGALDEAKELTEKRAPVRPVPLRDLALVLRAAPVPFARLVRFAARTGCRQEEAASLTWGQIDMQKGRCTFQRTKTGIPRVIELSPATLRLLQRTPRSPTTGYVFRSSQGERFQNVSSRFRELVARVTKPVGPSSPARAPSEVAGRAALPFRFHDMRHTFCIRWLQHGGDAWELARYVGHARFSTTEGYIAFLVRGHGSNPGSQARGGRRKPS